MQKHLLRSRQKSEHNFLYPILAAIVVIVFLLMIFPIVPEIQIASASIDSTLYGLTLTTNSKINIDVQPSPNGTISATKNTVVANTNSPSGYKLYLSVDEGEDGNMYLNGDSSNKNANAKFVPASGTFDAPVVLAQNSWGYAVAGLNNFDTSYNLSNISSTAKFAKIPTVGNEQLIHDHSGIATNDATDVYFAVNANTKIASGDYIAKILYTTFTDASSVVGGEAFIAPSELIEGYGTTMVTITTSVSTSKNIDQISATIGNKTCTGLRVIANNPLTISCTVPSGLTVGRYDVTVNVPSIGKSYLIEKGMNIKSPVTIYMQDIAEWASSLEPGVQTQAIDKRDGKLYWVAKLADGNIWMTQNLDYDLSITSNQTLTPETSDVTTTRTVTPVSWGTDVNSVHYKDGGDDYYANGTTKTSGYSSLPANDINRHYAAGDYYSWKAATAGQGTTSITNADVNESICPKGWRLPTSGSYTENYSFGKLTNAYGITSSADGTSDSALISSPLFFARGGYVYSGSLDYQGSNGYYWSSRARSGTSYAYSLDFSSSFVHPSNFGNRSNGFSVRCVSRYDGTITLSYDANGGKNAPGSSRHNGAGEIAIISSTIPTRDGYNFLGWAESKNATTPDYVYTDGEFFPSVVILSMNKTLYAVWEEKPILYMQDVATWAGSLAMEEQVQAIDRRDNKLYWVAKLKDGNIWMTQNLDFNISTTNVTPELSDVTNKWTTSSSYPARITGTTIYSSTSKTGTYSYDPGDYYWNGAWDPGSTNSTSGFPNSAFPNISSTPSTNGGEHYHVGNYYQWNAAIAGSGAAFANDSGVAEDSVCPKGWKLPDYSSDRMPSFYGLFSAYGVSRADSSKLIAAPLYFTAAGDVANGRVYFAGQDGRYWSNYASSPEYYGTGYSHAAIIYDGSNTYDTFVTRDGGYSVRCAYGINKSLKYDANGSSSRVPSSTSFNGASKSIAISKSPIPTRDGYTFLGYSTNASATTPEYAYDATANKFTPSSITVTKSTTLYAIWQHIDLPEDDEPATLYMQDVASWKGSLELEKQIRVIDKRDNKIYWVAKLKDGNIWMTQNLDFDITTSNVTSALSDVTKNWTSSSSYPARATSTTPFSNTSNTGTYSYDPGNYYWSGTLDTSGEISSSGLVTSVFTTIATNPPANIGNHYHVGNYYQWNAATAGTGGTLDGEMPEGTICPKGWTVPNDYRALFNAYGVTNNMAGIQILTSAPIYLVPAGHTYGGKVYFAGIGGRYWMKYGSSSTYYGAGYSTGAVFYGDEDAEALSSSFMERNGGLSVRCIAN